MKTEILGEESPQIAQSLAEETARQFGERAETPFAIVLRDADGALCGGVNGVTHWRWLYVRHLYVARNRRRQGCGRALLGAVEALATARGCLGVYLDTFDDAAAKFYERCGFVACGAIPDFPPGAQRRYFYRRL